MPHYCYYCRLKSIDIATYCIPAGRRYSKEKTTTYPGLPQKRIPKSFLAFVTVAE
jgi:hypothetical protein